MDMMNHVAEKMPFSTSLPFPPISIQLSDEGEQQQAAKRRKRRKGGGEMRKRRLTDEQVSFLETSFWAERKLESGRKVRLAAEAGLDPKQVAVWFQNRRARWKGKQLEEEYRKLRTAQEAVVVEKCLLEAQIFKLKEQLLDAEKEIRRLSSNSWEGVPSYGGNMVVTGPTTPFSIETNQPSVGELVGGEELVCIDEYYSLWEERNLWVV